LVSVIVWDCAHNETCIFRLGFLLPLGLTLAVLVILTLGIGISLAWRKSAKVERKLIEQQIPTMPTINLKEFFDGKPIPDSFFTVESEQTDQDIHYKTLEFDLNKTYQPGAKLQEEIEMQPLDEPLDTIDLALSKPYEWKWEVSKRRVRKCNLIKYILRYQSDLY
jgi:hypothetical protein